MFIVTNRNLLPAQTGLAQFGKLPNPEGPNTLRMVEVEPAGTGWRVDIVPDLLDQKWKAKAGIDAAWMESMGYDANQPAYGSMYVAKALFDRVNPYRAGVAGAKSGKGRDLLIFVHGYNNDLRDVVTRAQDFERNFGVEVLAFSWPADGGGIAGTASYLSDKNDAKISVGALDRTLAKFDDLLRRYNDAFATEINTRAADKFPDNDEAAREMAARLAEKTCPFNVNLVLHSMGNYLYKHLVFSTSSLGTKLMFDNVILTAADVNNAGHAQWVDRIRARKRVFITINENDHALRVSRMKLGEDQQARLGHWPFELNSCQGVYVDFTRARGVGTSHAYFEGAPLQNPAIKRFFRYAFTGEFAEQGVSYDAARNVYRIS